MLAVFQCNHLKQTQSLQDGCNMSMHHLLVTDVVIQQLNRSPSSNDRAIPNCLTRTIKNLMRGQKKIENWFKSKRYSFLYMSCTSKIVVTRMILFNNTYCTKMSY